MSAPPPSHDLDEVAPIPILPGPGEQLRTAREAAGMSVHEISTQMRLDSRVVLALEDDDYESLPAPTFIRGYLRGYARLLDLPPEPIIQAFEQREFAPPSLVADISVRSQMRSGDFPFRIVTYIVVAALIVLVVLWWKSQDFAPVGFDLMPEGDPQVAESDSAVPVDGSPTPEPELFSSVEEADTPDQFLAEPESTAPLHDATAAPEAETTSSSDAAAPGEAETAALPDEDSASDIEAEAGDESAPLITESESAGGEAVSSEVGEDAVEAADVSEEPATLPLVEETGAAEEAESPAAGEAAEEEAIERPADEEPAGAESEANPAVDAEPEALPESVASEAPAEAPDDEPPVAAETGDEVRLGTQGPADRLQMSFVVECWLEVYDHADEQLFYGLAQPDDQLDLSGRGPIRLVLGNSEGVQVRYNGTLVDFSAFTARGVARFSVGGEPPTAFETPGAPESAGQAESSGN